MKQQAVVKRSVLQKNGRILALPIDDFESYASHPNPIADYAEAVRRVESKIASEIDFYEGSHTFLLTHGSPTEKVIIFAHGFGSSPAPFKKIAVEFYDRGYNVLVMTMPYNGLADQLNTEQAKMRAEDFMRYGDEVVDIARALGDHVTMVGISGGGLVTAWVAQQRKDVDLAVLIAPGLGLKAIPRFLTRLAALFFDAIPNFYINDDPKKESPRPYNYTRISSRAVAQIMRLGLVIKALARQKAPAAGSIVVITNLNDPGIDNVAVNKVAELWRTRRADDVQTYQFSAELGLGHDIIDVTDPHMNVEVVYPKLLELLDQ